MDQYVLPINHIASKNGLFSLLETISLKIREKPLSWKAKCSLPVSVLWRPNVACFNKLPNSCNPIGQYSVLLFILTFDWLMESIQIFLKLDGLFKAEVNIPAKAILFILNLDSW